ncbi:MAG TPA: hypothetical protein VGR14_16990 [Verrucomicrobiae bacterium]|jgi:hypothetical protein|nr:hypothetical protein [Verrucomicrobiae bacterium]
MKRRSFIKASLAASATVTVPGFVGQLSAQVLAADTLAFRNFQARDGFLVSPRKNAGGAYHAVIRARRDHQCQVMNHWPGRPVVVHEVQGAKPVALQLDKSNGECLAFAARIGHTYGIKQTGL